MMKEYAKPKGDMPAGSDYTYCEPGMEGKEAVMYQIKNGGIGSQEKNPDMDS